MVLELTVSVVTECQITGCEQHPLYSVEYTAIRKRPYVNKYILKKKCNFTIFFKKKTCVKIAIFNSLK